MRLQRSLLVPIFLVVILAAATISAQQQFAIKGGQIYDPFGNIYVPIGINVGDNAMASSSTNDQAQPLTDLFPGINHVRLNTGPTSNGGTGDATYPPPSFYLTFVEQVTGYTQNGDGSWSNNRQGSNIVVEIEDHVSNGGTINGVPAPPLQGAALEVETSWYASLASTFSGNPYVWFGTMNEPNGNPVNSYELNAVAAVSVQQVAIYNAIRDTGSMAVLQCMAGLGGSNPGTVGANGGFIVDAYANMTNIVWEMHAYYTNGDAPNFNDGVLYTTAMGYLTGAVTAPGYYGGWGYIAAQSIQSADGLVPVIFGEWGSDDGNTDSDEASELAAALQNITSQGYGSTAWQWSPNGGGPGAWVLVNNGIWGGTMNLTEWGQEVADLIQAVTSSSDTITSVIY